MRIDRRRAATVIIGILAVLLALVARPKPSLAAVREDDSRWALVVGIDHYDSDAITPLHCADADAKSLAQTLCDVGGFPREHVILLTSDAKDAKYRPTSANLLMWLENFHNVVKPGDTLVFYFSGHGVREEDVIQEHDTQRTEAGHYLITMDTVLGSPALLKKSAVSLREIKEALQEIKASQLLLLVDACRDDVHAGQRGPAGANKMTPSFSRDLAVSARAESKSTDGKPASGVELAATLFACKVGERSFEGYNGHGYFTWFLVEGLRGAAATPDGVVTLDSLKAYLERKVPPTVRFQERGQAQNPWADVSGTGSSQFILSRPGTSAAGQSTAVSSTAQVVVTQNPAPTATPSPPSPPAVAPTHASTPAATSTPVATPSALPVASTSASGGAPNAVSTPAAVGLVPAAGASSPTPPSAAGTWPAATVLCMAPRPDGQGVVSGHWDGTVRFWDLNAQRRTAVVKAHAANVTSIAVTPDGRSVLTGGRDCKACLWDIAQWQLKHEFPQKFVINGVATQPGGRQLAVAWGQLISLYDASTCQLERTLTVPSNYYTVWDVQYLGDGKTVAVSFHDQHMRVFDVASGRVLHTFDLDNVPRHVAASPDGQLLACTCDDKNIWIFQVASERRFKLEGHISNLWCLAFSPDGTQLASGDDSGTVRIWDLTRGITVRTLLAEDRCPVYSVLFTPDNMVVTGDQQGRVKLWDAKSGLLRATLGQ